MFNYGKFTCFLRNPYGFLRVIYAYLRVVYGLRIFYGSNQYENQVFHMCSFFRIFPSYNPIFSYEKYLF